MNEPYVNQYMDLWKTSLMRLFWENGPTHPAENIGPNAEPAVQALIAKFAHVGAGNPVNGHVYRATENVSSSGYYNGDMGMLNFGVTHTVNLDETRNDGGAAKHLWNGQTDDGMVRNPDWFSNVAEFFLPDFKADPTCRIHVNCAAGASRAPSMAYFLVRATTGLSVLESKATVYAANSVNGRNISITYWQDAERALHRLGLVKDPWVM